LFFLALCCALQTSRAQTLQGELQARYREFSRAIQRHDLKFLEEYLSPTFTGHLPNGQVVDRAASLKAFGDLMSDAQSIKWIFDLTDLKLTSRGVQVRAAGWLTGTGVGEDKKKHRVEVRGLTIDTWVLQGTRWVLERLDMLKLEGTIDGQAAPVPGVAP
jgi:hypothetical protein